MKIFGNKKKTPGRIVSIMLAAALVLSSAGCASAGKSGEDKAGQAKGQQELAEADQVSAEVSTADEAGAGAGRTAENMAAVNEEGAGAAAAEAVKQGNAEAATAAEAAEAAATTAPEAAATTAAAEAGTGSSAASAEPAGTAAKKAAEPAEDQAEIVPEEPTVREDGGVSMNVFAMDTYMTLLAYGDKAEKAVRAAAKEIHALDEQLSTGIKTSEICRLNAAGGGEPSEDVELLISESLELSKKTDGLFDIAIYPVMKLWGFPTQEYRVPQKAEIEKALKLADVSGIRLVTRKDVKAAQKAAAEAVKKAEEEAEKAKKEADKKAREDAARKEAAEASAAGQTADAGTEKAEGKAAGKNAGTTAQTAEAAAAAAAEARVAQEKKAAAQAPSAPSVTFEIKGLEIDLGGIAKGFTGDRVGEIFSRYNIQSGIISLGGNVQAYGTKTNGKPWRVAIQNPESSMEYLGVLDIQDKAVVTSGGYERFFEEKGVRYHHIIDPRTGYPAESGLISATIVCDQGILADGLSTSLFIMGKDQAEKFWRESGLDFDYILEDEEGTLYVTEGIAGALMTDAKVEVVYR